MAVTTQPIGKDGRPLVKYVIQPRKILGTSNQPLTAGMFINSDELFFDDNYDRAAHLVKLGVLAPVDDAFPVPDVANDSAKVAKAKAAAEAAKADAEAAEANAADRQAQLDKVMSILTPEQLEQIQGQAKG